MIQIKPIVNTNITCASCKKGNLESKGIIYQGVHVFYDAVCEHCNEEIIATVPIRQAILQPFQLKKVNAAILQGENVDWIIRPAINTLRNPITTPIQLNIEKRTEGKKKAIIVNTLDNCYGHSLLHYLNLQNIIEKKGEYAVIIIIQPFLKWLLPIDGVDEVWTANVSFAQMKDYYKDLNDQINQQSERFQEIQLSHAHLNPTDIDISKYSKIPVFDFENPPIKPRLTFVWREDVNRYWVKSYWIYGGLRKLGIAKLLFPLHYLRILILLYRLHFKFKDKYQISLAGLGKMGWFPNFVKDERVEKFNKETEIRTTEIYAESELIIGVHGSSMILPSAHAGMTISIMPLKRWGNFAEDILFVENDVRLASFQRRTIPMNTSILETSDICANMLLNRSYFIKKFIYDKNVL